MNQSVKKIIEKIYINHDFEFFVSSCRAKLVFFDDLIEKIKPLCKDIEDYSDALDPAVELRIIVNESNSKGISIEYTTILKLSKIAKFYYLQHEFSLENPDDDKMDSYLDSFRDEPYNKKQFLLEKKINDFMEDIGYTRLSYYETEEVCPDIQKFRNDSESQMTVGNAIFMDFWELCSE